MSGRRGARSHQSLVHLGRAEIAEQFEVLAQGQERGALGLQIGGQTFPLGAAHGSEQDGLRVLADLQGLGRQRLAVVVDGQTAHVGVGQLGGKVEFLGDGGEHAFGLLHDFGSNSVSGQYGNAIRAHYKS